MGWFGFCLLGVECGGDGCADQFEGTALKGGRDSEFVDAGTAAGEGDGVAGEGSEVVEEGGQVVGWVTVGGLLA